MQQLQGEFFEPGRLASSESQPENERDVDDRQAEQAASSMAGVDEAQHPPIRFEDAVGRKFNFPWPLVRTWEGMEELIRQASNHVGVMRPHVDDGHYDLVGSDGEIILPQLWESIVRPDTAVKMHMW